MFAGWIQTFLYRLFIRAGDPMPTPGSPRFVRDRKYIYCFVILAYLLFTMYECWLGITSQSTFYQMLGLPVDANDKLIKKEFRKAYVLSSLSLTGVRSMVLKNLECSTIKYHPDKVGPDKQHLFMHYKVAFDVLS